jgi:CBS domain containing-hemolysin-like protein
MTPLASIFASVDSGFPIWVSLAIIPVLIAINGFFVAAEFAVVAIRKTRVEELVNQNRPRAKALMEAVVNMDRSVAAAQLGITVASLALGVVSEPALAKMIEPFFANLPSSWQGPITRLVSVGLTLGFITYFHVVFGEQMPKIAALQDAERIGLLIAPPLNLFARFSNPLIRFMNGSSTAFLRWCGFRPPKDDGEVYTVDELRLLIEDTEEAGLIDPEAADYLRNVFSLSNKKVRDVMVPQEKVAGLELHAPPEQVMAAVRDGAHTRMPVYDGSWNKVVGIVNTKDLFFLFTLRNVVILEDAIYPAQFLDPDEPVANALRLFRKSHRPMAVVKDASGQMLGILTLEDVLEEIVGDIEDEHDEPGRKTSLMKRLRRRLPKS